jgi:hypothetical protein
MSIFSALTTTWDFPTTVEVTQDQLSLLRLISAKPAAPRPKHQLEQGASDFANLERIESFLQLSAGFSRRQQSPRGDGANRELSINKHDFLQRVSQKNCDSWPIDRFSLFLEGSAQHNYRGEIATCLSLLHREKTWDRSLLERFVQFICPDSVYLPKKPWVSSNTDFSTIF